MNKFFYFTILGMFILSACGENIEKKFLDEQSDGIYARIETNKGNMFLKLEHSKVPMTVANFVGLAEGSIPNDVKAIGTPYYNGLKFHRVVNDFMIQGGCPEGTGMAGPGYNFEDEIHPDLRHDGPGVLSMANAGPGTNGSQFFITHKETSWLDGKHTVFGRVIQGQDIVDATEQNDSIIQVKILRKGPEALAFDAPKIFETEKENVANRKAEEMAKLESMKAEIKAGFSNETASGLMYEIITLSKGPKPKATDVVTVHYEGSFLDGNVFDSSLKRGEPAQFPLNQVIPGWTEGVQLMNVGSKFRFYIPYQLAYGEQGFPGGIPPKSDLIFEVELLKVAAAN
jgi:peptidyl-prolyl cis-trans isomerase A (cyclophilin A)